MADYIVTGATGHIGNVVVRKLAERGEKVKAIVRNKSNLKCFEGVECDIVYGNFDADNFLCSIVKEGDIVIHCAGKIEIGSGAKEEIMRINYEGTKLVVDVCLKNRAGKLVYVSSVDCFLKEKAGVVTEPEKFFPEKQKSAYAKSKALATEYVLDACRNKGLNGVIVYPTAVTGRYDWKVSNIGQVIKDYQSGKNLARINGGYNFVDVEDVANGIILAAEKGRSGEGYILSGEGITVDEMFEILRNLKGKKNLPVKIPAFIVEIFAPLAELYYKARKIKPAFTKKAIKVLNSNYNYSSQKAEKELGYMHVSAKQAITNSYEWFKNIYCEK